MKIQARKQPLVHRDEVRMMAVDPERKRYADARAVDLPALLSPGDLLVVNDAATLPASLFGRTEAGDPIEVRLAAYGEEDSFFRAVLFGAGDWRTKTEDRAAPPQIDVGHRLLFGELSATVVATSPMSARLIDLMFDRSGSALWQALYAVGQPVQYSYLAGDLPLDAVQTSYGARPYAFEMPSAGRPLSFAILSNLRARGVEIATLLHSAGLSATGDPALDAALPFPERYEIPAETVRLIEETHAKGGRVIAVGTTVVRALEGCHRQHGRLIAGAGVTDLVIDQSFAPSVVDGLISGIHEPSESHYRLLRAFADDELLQRAVAHAEHLGYTNHELGDLMLLS